MLMISILSYSKRKAPSNESSSVSLASTWQRQTCYIARFLVAKMQARDNGNIHAWKIKKKSHITVKFGYLEFR
jgi:hypothetical protein